MGYRKIVVGTDGSDTAAIALSVAARLAARCDADLVIAMGWEPPHLDAETAQEVLDYARQSVARDGLRVDSESQIGEGSAVLVDVARRRDADLVVVGNKGMGRARRFGLNGVPDRVAHTALCDVLIVKTSHEGEAVDRAEGLWQHMVVGTDGSPTATEAATKAFELATMVRADVTLVYVGDPILGAIALEDTSKSRIGRMTVNPRVFERGEPADVICTAAEEAGADLIVVGNKGMSGARRYLLSSVPNQVAHAGHGDVLVARTVGRTVEDLRPGHGGVVLSGGARVAAYLDEQGALHAVSPRCTHMGCTVDWNEAERTWDCPCHGSRYDFDGHVIHGPAQRDLDPA